VCVCVCVYMCMCVYVCMYVYVCVCMCMLYCNTGSDVAYELLGYAEEGTREALVPMPLYMYRMYRRRMQYMCS
jgi:hypothetical protein